MRTRSKPKQKKSKWLLTSVIIILVLIIGAAVVWGAGVLGEIGSFKKNPGDSIINKENPDIVVDIPTWEGKERVNILLLGGDAREAEGAEHARSDSMMVASIDPVTKQANLFSILRDTYTDIEGYGKGRINTAITLGGAPLAMQTIGDLLGLEIQYFVYTDFEGFKALVDAIGGVNYTVEKDMKYTDNADKNRYDINLKAGYQLLDGDKALQYVRFRHDAMSDYTRTERQRAFITTVAKETLSTWNIINMKKILESVSPYVETNMSITHMLKLGQTGIGIKMGDSAQIPPFDYLREENKGGASILTYTSKEDIQNYVQEVVTPKPDATINPTGGTEATNSSTSAE
ncbi:MAG: LCP family protein [Candidatus Pristimantibacillus lignocellulolyticus]|uniref:LCP family protein n=1 Tax=Candidatus Pristimantibacillus lignocellulolyticus TaxID=2994561 RepID=A0A9J6ZG97_9BACL|nr:MAG: LCP family protein [Candidatus Pristimantibacillus lignocellulolyticus]